MPFPINSSGVGTCASSSGIASLVAGMSGQHGALGARLELLLDMLEGRSIEDLLLERRKRLLERITTEDAIDVLMCVATNEGHTTPPLREVAPIRAAQSA